MSGCPSCGRHRDWGCSFECPERRPPLSLNAYRPWAEEQKHHYARGEVPGEQRTENVNGAARSQAAGATTNRRLP